MADTPMINILEFTRNISTCVEVRINHQMQGEEFRWRTRYCAEVSPTLFRLLLEQIPSLVDMSRKPET